MPDRPVIPTKPQDTVHPDDAVALVAARNETLGSIAKAYLDAMTLNDLNDGNAPRVFVI